MAQRKKQKALDKINDIIKWTSDAGSIKSQTICINRSCTVYGIINELMDKNQLRYLDRSECFCGEDGEWIIQMSEQIKAHWDKERTFQEKHLENVKMNLQKEQIGKRDKALKVRSIEEQIKDAEEHNRQFTKEHPELSKTGGLTTFGR